ncbi:MAG: hypothetical protein R6V56_03900 [Lentisphaeria bacterium]
MGNKFVNDRLLHSKSLSKQDRERNDSPKSVENSQSPSVKPEGIEPEKSELDSLVEREHKAIRGKAEERNMQEIDKRRREIKQKLEEFLADLDGRRKSLDKEVTFCRELQAELNRHMNPVTPHNAGDIRRLVKQIDLEMLKLQNSSSQSQDARQPLQKPLSVLDLGFWQLTKIGLGFTWPLIVTLLAVAFVISLVLLNVFSL